MLCDPVFREIALTALEISGAVAAAEKAFKC